MKKNIILLLIACILTPFLLQGQTEPTAKVIYKSNNNLLVNSVVASDDNGYMMLADYNSAAMIVKLDSLCEIEWSKKVVGSIASYNSILNFPDSSYLIAGRLQNSQASLMQLFLAKINVIGDTIWTKSYGNQKNIIVNSSSLTSDSGFIISGYENNSDNMKSMFVSKFDKMGGLIWHRVIDIPDWQSVCYSVREMSDNSVVATGYISNNVTYEKLISIIKIAQNGDVMWLKKCVADDGIGFDIVENSQGFQVLGRCNYRMAMVKCDEYGEIITATTYDIGFDFEMPDVETPKLCSTNNSTYIFSTSESWWAGHVVEIDTLSRVVDSWDLLLLSRNIIKSDNENYLIYGNGPLVGVKSSPLYGEYQIGVISGVLGNFQTECSYSRMISQRYDTITTDMVTCSYSGNLELVPCSFSCENITLDSRDGCVDIIGEVNDNSEESVINVFPNPAKDKFTIQSSVFENESCNIEIVDMLGRKVTETLMTSGTKTVLINTNKWEHGLYVIRININGSVVGSEKIVIE